MILMIVLICNIPRWESCELPVRQYQRKIVRIWSKDPEIFLAGKLGQISHKNKFNNMWPPEDTGIVSLGFHSKRNFVFPAV